METSSSVSCGAWGCRPRWLQRFATPHGFLLVYGFLGTTQSMAYLYFVATLTTMERRFKIPSRTTGLMLSGNEISQILLSLLLTYFGGRGNRPRWIAWGVAISALSCFILALPHALYGPGSSALELTQEYLDQQYVANDTFFDLIEGTQKGEADSRLCDINSVTEAPLDPEDQASCIAHHEADNQDGYYSKVPIVLVFISQFVLGIGTTLYFALGQIYLDDNSRKKNTPLLLAMTMALRTLGPALGFALGFGCLSLYVDPTLTPLINKKDPRWIGAWWLGWIILGITMFIFAGLIALFPRHLPPTVSKKDKINDPSNPAAEKLIPKPPEHGKATLKEFPVALRRLVTNKLLMYNIASTIFYILGGSGFITFSTKYLEVQYNQSAAGASMLAGTTGLMAMVVGFLASGYVISKYRPRPRLLLFWNVIAGCVFIVAELVFIVLGCPDHQLHGTGLSGQVELITECNMECNCPQDQHFAPVCIGNTTFFSPCHAGCEMITDPNNHGPNMTFTACKCAAAAFLPGSNVTFDSVLAKEGACVPTCGAMFIAFMVVTCFMHMIGSSARVGNILVNFRCVEPQDKAFAQGLALVLISLFAFIPGPIIFGSVIDATCLIWNESCGRRGNCVLYDKTDFRLYFSITSASITTIAVILDVVVWYLGKNLKLYDEEETQRKKIYTRKKIPHITVT